MSIDSVAPDTSTYAASPAEQSVRWDLAHLPRTLAALASLRLTVTLFALSIILIFVATLAQAEKDIWQVIAEYFRTWFAWFEFRTFFPKSFFPKMPVLSGGFYFPGGKLIGILLASNLVAAHAIRFKVQAHGTRFWAGLATLSIGMVFTTWIILSGQSREGIQGLPMVSYQTMWQICKLFVGALGVGTAYYAWTLNGERRTEKWLAGAATAILLALFTYLMVTMGGSQLNDSSMRILWQLIQGGLAGLILLLGCWMLFKKRGGIVLIHAGVGLLMFGEFLVAMSAVEQQITLAEGESTTFARDIRTVELAVIDTSDPDKDVVVAIPKSRLKVGETIAHPALPFDLELLEYFPNSRIEDMSGSEPNLATAGFGLKYKVTPTRSANGAGMDQRVDIAGAYLKVTPHDEKQPPQTYLLSQQLSEAKTMTSAGSDLPEKIQHGDRTYHLALRFKRTYKPYSIHLTDVKKEDYLGTNTPRNYSSDIQLVDRQTGTPRDIKIWMNNPLRYAGETFYQSNYLVDPQGKEMSTLSVVSNMGWMIPYVACMLVAVGLVYHFGGNLTRFLKRRFENSPTTEAPHLMAKDHLLQSERPAATVGESRLAVPWTTYVARPSVYLPILVVLAAACWIYVSAQPQPVGADEFNWERFGSIPIVYQGRVKPIDTLARNSLRVISDRQTASLPNPAGSQRKYQRVAAIRWLLDTIAGADQGRNYPIFRIQNPEVLQLLGLERRKGYRYAPGEFGDEAALEVAYKSALERNEIDPGQLTTLDRKVMELVRRKGQFIELVAAFQPAVYPPMPSPEAMKENPEAAQAQLEQIRQSMIAAAQKDRETMSRPQLPPLVVPTDGKEFSWVPYSVAINSAYVQRALLGQEVDAKTMAWATMLDHYARNEPREFNRAVDKYHSLLLRDAPQDVDPAKVDFELFFNRLAPFYLAAVLYLFAFVLSAVGWVAWPTVLNRAAFWLIVLTFLLHTFAVGSRIYISGRPPVTNLYSSAVFIGWGAVLFAIVLESVYRIGIGNALAGICGFATLLIAHLLSADGDTFKVLEAVLDTQFWLATHVVCVSLGYATTFVAGGLGIFYILFGWLTPRLDKDMSKSLARMIYGVLCFALYFSFVGTVLGGLWADDSWGRFWGWDPKENGALMIVIWNALILHARWGGMVRERGMAVLAVAGNIMTGWSWFGVNELGVGLHSYGFTEGVMLALSIFVLTQLAIIGIGVTPLSNWRSFRQSA